MRENCLEQFEALEMSRNEQSGVLRLSQARTLAEQQGLHGPLVFTRLMALKHGASLVWSPEVVDKAILYAECVVDHQSLGNSPRFP